MGHRLNVLRPARSKRLSLNCAIYYTPFLLFIQHEFEEYIVQKLVICLIVVYLSASERFRGLEVHLVAVLPPLDDLSDFFLPRAAPVGFHQFRRQLAGVDEKDPR